MGNRVRPRFFDQVGHETMYASSGNKGFPNEPDVGYRNFFIPRAAGPREVSFFFPRAYFKVFYNPRDEEISIPETNGPFGKPIPV